MLLVHAALMFQLHGERRQAGVVIFVTRLASARARLAVLARLTAARVLAARLVVAATTPGKRLTAAEHGGDIHLLVVARHGELRAATGLVIFDGLDQAPAVFDSLAVNRRDHVTGAESRPGRRSGRINLRDLRPLGRQAGAEGK